MNLLSRMREAGGFEQVIALSEPSCGLSGFAAIHDTTRGPATGGIRLRRYPSELDALEDAFRLAKAMTFKAAAAGLPVGGGKIVLLDHDGLVREEALRAVGRFLEGLGGRFLAGRDVGLPVADGALVRSETRYMVDESEQGVSDLNRSTAIGVAAGARAALEHRCGRSSWRGVRVAVQGAGGVGSWLARWLFDEGAELVVADPRSESLEALAASGARFETVAPDRILEVEAELFAPCALGGVIGVDDVDRLRFRVVAGSANNVLREPDAGRALHEAGITYAPDYLINAGALIQGVRFLTRGERLSPEALETLGERTAALLRRARERNEPPEVLLERETLAILASRRGFRHWFVPAPKGRTGTPV